MNQWTRVAVAVMSSLLRVACSVDDGRPNGIMAPVAGWTHACTYSTALARSRRQPVLWRGRHDDGRRPVCSLWRAISVQHVPGPRRIASHRIVWIWTWTWLDWTGILLGVWRPRLHHNCTCTSSSCPAVRVQPMECRRRPSAGAASGTDQPLGTVALLFVPLIFYIFTFQVHVYMRQKYAVPPSMA